MECIFNATKFLQWLREHQEEEDGDEEEEEDEQHGECGTPMVGVMRAGEH